MPSPWPLMSESYTGEKSTWYTEPPSPTTIPRQLPPDLEPPTSPARGLRFKIPLDLSGRPNDLGVLQTVTQYSPPRYKPRRSVSMESGPSNKPRTKTHRRSTSLNTTASVTTPPSAFPTQACPERESRWKRGLRRSLSLNTEQDPCPTPKSILKPTKRESIDSMSVNASITSTRRVTLSLPAREDPQHKTRKIKSWTIAAAQSATSLLRRKAVKPQVQEQDLDVDELDLEPEEYHLPRVTGPWNGAMGVLVHPPGVSPTSSVCSLQAGALDDRTWFPPVEDVWKEENKAREELDRIWDARYMPPPVFVLGPRSQKRTKTRTRTQTHLQASPAVSMPRLSVDMSESWSGDEILLTPVVSNNALGLEGAVYMKT